MCYSVKAVEICDVVKFPIAHVYGVLCDISLAMMMINDPSTDIFPVPFSFLDGLYALIF